MDKKTIEALAIANGFKLKQQPDGAMALNPYVFDFAEAVLRATRTDNTCHHDDLVRQGAIWTKCEQCGKRWADDEGGVPKVAAPVTPAKAEAPSQFGSSELQQMIVARAVEKATPAPAMGEELPVQQGGPLDFAHPLSLQMQDGFGKRWAHPMNYSDLRVAEHAARREGYWAGWQDCARACMALRQPGAAIPNEWRDAMQLAILALTPPHHDNRFEDGFNSCKYAASEVVGNSTATAPVSPPAAQEEMVLRRFGAHDMAGRLALWLSSSMDQHAAVDEMRKHIRAWIDYQIQPITAPAGSEQEKNAARWEAFEKALRHGAIPGAAHGRRFKIVETCPMYGTKTEFSDFVASIDAALAAQQKEQTK